jgi:uncharacterized membrane protein
MSTPSKPLVLPPRNPLTHARHRHETFWQIIFPVMLSLLLVLVMVALLVYLAAQEAQDLNSMPPIEETALPGDLTQEEVSMLQYQRSDTHRLSLISQIWLIIPVMILSLVAVAVLAGLIYLASNLLGIAPGYMRLAQDILIRVRLRVGSLTDSAVEPFLMVKSMTAAARQARRSTSEQFSSLFSGRSDEHSG